MTNEQLLALLPEKGNLERRRDELRASLAALRLELEKVEDQVWRLSQVSEVYEGACLYLWESGTTTHVSLTAGDRWAEVYENVAKPGRFGLRVKGHTTDVFYGANWDRHDALRAAKDWAAHGTEPARRN